MQCWLATYTSLVSLEDLRSGAALRTFCVSALNRICVWQYMLIATISLFSPSRCGTLHCVTHSGCTHVRRMRRCATAAGNSPVLARASHIAPN